MEYVIGFALFFGAMQSLLISCRFADAGKQHKALAMIFIGIFQSFIFSTVAVQGNWLGVWTQ